MHTPYPDAPLTVTAPGEESGTFDSFVEIVIDAVGEALGVEDATVPPDYTASPNDNVIIEGIAANPTSLGWVGFAFVEENLDVVKPLQVDGGGGCVEPTAETIASGEYPIARDLFIYVNAPSSAENPALEAFVDFYVTEGITTLVGSDEGQVPYVPLGDEAVGRDPGRVGSPGDRHPRRRLITVHPRVTSGGGPIPARRPSRLRLTRSRRTHDGSNQHVPPRPTRPAHPSQASRTATATARGRRSRRAALTTFAVTLLIIVTLVFDAWDFICKLADSEEGLGSLFEIGWFPRRGHVRHRHAGRRAR